MEWDLTYDLELDADWVADVQRTTLNTDSGLVAEPALLGSPEWWDAIKSGQLATHHVDGTISKVYWGSMADWPEVEITEGEQSSSWTRRGDLRRYVKGLRSKLSFVRMSYKPNDRGFDRTEIVLKTWVEQSSLRSCEVAPGPGNAGFRGLTTLYRPVGLAELALIERADHKRFPPRLPGQEIFYPVVDEPYAVQIARDWNTKDSASGFTGFVTAFHVRDEFLSRFEIHEAGGRERREYWVPAGDLDEFNASLVGRIDVTARFGPASS